MQGGFEDKRSPDQESDLDTKLSRYFFKQLKFNNSSQGFHKDEADTENDYDIDDEDEDEEEFSFMCGGADSSPIAADDAFINGQIKPIFPLFSRDLFSGGDFLHENLPTKPPVKKLFVETKDSGEASSDGAYCERLDRKAVEVSPEICKKSNSTGFSKIWRFKDFMGRSNSDGRDAFVFLNENSQVAVSGKGEKKVERKMKKGKTASLSAHEVYLRSKAKDGEKRRSYLPYRPELVGFFTNVNSGLSKNVHPY